MCECVRGGGPGGLSETQCVSLCHLGGVDSIVHA